MSLNRWIGCQGRDSIKGTGVLQVRLTGHVWEATQSSILAVSGRREVINESFECQSSGR